LLCTWARSGRAPGPVAWVSLDATDNDRRRFWILVLRALQAAGVGEPVASLEVPTRAGVGGFAQALLDALAERDPPMVLVLDDFHEVSAAVSPALEELVRHPVPGLRLVVASRVDPPLRLGRLMVAGEVTQLHTAELACTAHEAETLLKSAGAPLGEEGVRRLWAHTEGWPAALRLAAASLRTRADKAVFLDEFTGDHVAVSDYLVSEVLSRQPADVREFLLRTSVVDTLDGELADALSGRSGGQGVLAHLEHSGVPVAAIDEHLRWYRYHGMFAEFLRAQLALEQPRRVKTLHARAAEVLAARGDDVVALRHAVVGRAWPLAARLVAEQGVGMILGGRIEAVAPLAGLPPEQQERHPELALALAALLLERGDRTAAEASLARAIGARGSEAVVGECRASFRRMLVLVRLQLARMDRDFSRTASLAEALLDGDDQADEPAVAELRSFALANVGIATLWMGDLQAAGRTLERALAAARQAESDWPALVASSFLALAADFLGDLGQMTRRADEAIAIAERRGWMNTWAAVPALQLRANAAAQRLQLDEAERWLQQAERALDRGRQSLLSLLGRTIRALMLEARGRLEEALDEVRAVREGARALNEHPYLAGLQQVEARLLISLGRIEPALEVLGPPGANGAANSGLLAERARVYLLEGDPAAARATLAPALHDDRRQIAHLPAMAWLVEALARDGQHDPPGADQALTAAIDILAAAGMVRPLVLYGRTLVSLLERQLDQGTAHRAFIAQALSVLNAHHPTAGSSGDGVEPLTERELQVLGYLPTMLSASEIADELIVSHNTVRSHLKAIYRKLGSHRRTEAVRRARQLRLLDP
jgi:LuxR family transcriptional regulator, maltose regulon positive regulatory protein